MWGPVDAISLMCTVREVATYLSDFAVSRQSSR
jgi:hypothetical protein